MTFQHTVQNGTPNFKEHNLRVSLVTKGACRVVIREIWENSAGELSRPDGPALLERAESGALLWEEWWEDGRKHRADGGPAVADYDEEGCGTICVQEWWQNGKRHRLDGPARIYFDPCTKEPIDIEWWVGGYNIKPGEMTSAGKGNDN